jgi:hypothetical protein
LNRRALAGRAALLPVLAVLPGRPARRPGVKRIGCLALALLAAIGCGSEGGKGKERGGDGADPERGFVPVSPQQGASAPDRGPREESPDARRSAGLFVGVATFADPLIPDVDFACDDAVDLAYLLTEELRLLRPEDVALLLAGEPKKTISKDHLQLLRGSGARVGTAEGWRISELAGEMARPVGPRGTLVLAFATHGYAVGGQHFLLAQDSSPGQHRDVSVERLVQAIHLGKGALRLVVLDVCRAQDPDLRGMREVFTAEGKYAWLSAAGPGHLSFSDGTRNGIFTGALLDGLQCGAQPDPDGFVTLAGLSRYLSREVPRRSDYRQTPEVTVGGGLVDVALRRCSPAQPVGEILSPAEDAIVGTAGEVRARVLRRGFYAVAVIYAVRDGVYHRQAPHGEPAEPGSELRLGVQFGLTGSDDRFQVYVALSTDPLFLSAKPEFSDRPERDAAGQVVHWLGPVNVVGYSN